MLASHRSYLGLKQGLGSAAFNVLLNGAIALVVLRHATRVALFAWVGIATDTLSTTFMLPFSTCIVVTFLVRRDMKRGRIPPLNWTRAGHPRLLALGALTVLQRALVLGVACALVLTPAVVAGFELGRHTSLALWPFVIFKATLAGVLAGLVTPLIAVWALTGPRPSLVAAPSRSLQPTRENSSAQLVPP